MLKEYHRKLRNNCFQWQFYWKPHLSYKTYIDEEFGIIDHILCIGFWQFWWVTSAIKMDD